MDTKPQYYTPKQSWTVEQQNTFLNGCLQGGDSQKLCIYTLQYFQARYSPDEYIRELNGAQNASVWASAKDFCNNSSQTHRFMKTALQIGLVIACILAAIFILLFFISLLVAFSGWIIGIFGFGLGIIILLAIFS